MSALTLDLRAACEALSSRSLTAEHLTLAVLAEIERLNPQLNCFTHVFGEQARSQARASDLRRRSGAVLGALDGIPVSIKANIAVEAAPHHAGLEFRRDLLASADAAVVARLRTQGAVLLGITNMDEGALGARGHNRWFGEVVNPYGDEQLAGGSSAGAAVALAAQMGPLALGSDTIGSVRIPAAYCGIAALKPSYAAISTRGLVHTHPRFDHIGPMTRCVADLDLALAALAGYDSAWHLSFPVQLQPPDADAKCLKIAFAVGLDATPPSPQVVEGYNATIAALRTLGHELQHVDVSNWNLPRAARAIFSLCEVEMARTHADRLRTAPETLSPQLQEYLRFGAAQTRADLQRFENRIAALDSELASLLQRCDYLLTPTVPTVVRKAHDAEAVDSSVFTAIASANGYPAIAFPVGRAASDAPPASMQLVGPRGSDYRLIRLAQSLDAAIS